MKNRVSAAGYEELRAEMRLLPADVQTPNGFETVMKFPERVGRGVARVFRLRDGLDITAVDCELREELVMEVAPFPARMELNHCFSGRGYGRVEGSRAKMGVEAGQSTMFFAPECGMGVAEYPARTRISAVEIGLSPEFVRGFLDNDEPGPQPTNLLRSVHEANDHFFRAQKTNPAMKLALRAILECPLEGAARRVYLEAKALELLAMQLADFTETPKKNGEPPRLDPDDAKRVEAAAEVLAHDMLDPPSLLDLARAVGLNDYKLKVGFKEIFGTTAFGYLHERRMDLARTLLEEGDMNVGEVAAGVGFKDHSSFSAAFKRRYGVRPGSLRLRLPTPRI